MAKLFKIKGLEGGNNQVTTTTNITIEINKSVYENFSPKTTLIFEIKLFKIVQQVQRVQK